MSAVIPLDELLILSSLDDRKLYLLSPEARCQSVLSVYTDILLADKTLRVASPPPPLNVTMTLFWKKLFGDAPLTSGGKLSDILGRETSSTVR